MLRYATETYYENKIARLEAKIAKLTAKLQEMGAEPVDNDE
jgi:hypothetical protein